VGWAHRHRRSRIIARVPADTRPTDANAIAASGGSEPSECLVCRCSLAGGAVLSTPDHKRIAAAGTYRVLVCPSCEGGTSAPLVGAADLGAFYASDSEDYAPHVSGGLMRPLFRIAMRTRLRLNRLFGRLRGRAPGLVLDVGCGRGDLLAALADRGWEVVGLDPSPAAVSAARDRGVEAIEGSIESVELEPESFDAIVFHHSLEHVTDPIEALRSACAALRPGGLLMVGIPNFGSNRARRYGERWWLLELPRHRFHFTPAALGIALRKAGFDVDALWPAAAMIGTTASLQQRLRGEWLETGPLFLASYGLTLPAFPVAWASNELRGGGELLNAVATKPLR
jgi:SAM-dependent methyltransferase